MPSGKVMETTNTQSREGTKTSKQEKEGIETTSTQGGEETPTTQDVTERPREEEGLNFSFYILVRVKPF